MECKILIYFSIYKPNIIFVLETEQIKNAELFLAYYILLINVYWLIMILFKPLTYTFWFCVLINSFTSCQRVLEMLIVSQLIKKHFAIVLNLKVHYRVYQVNLFNTLVCCMIHYYTEIFAFPGYYAAYIGR